MYYKKSKDIEDRFTLAVAIIYFMRPGIETLATRLNVSRPTVVRMISELRRRGNDIVVVRNEAGWHYEIRRIAVWEEQAAASWALKSANAKNSVLNQHMIAAENTGF